MSHESFRVSPVVRSAILESYERLKKGHRDAVTGELLDKQLTHAVLTDLTCRAENDTNLANIIRQGKHEAWSSTVYLLIREQIRTAKGVYETHTRAQKPQRTKRMRYDVTFRDKTGKRVTKDRRFLRKDELPLVWEEYERRGTANMDIATWCHEVWDQMELRGFGDDILVGEVVTLSNDDTAVA